jgi:hypothetical protein
MDETVREQLSSLVNVSTCLHGVAQDFMYYSHVTSFGFIVAWAQEWNMKQQLGYCCITLSWQAAYKPCNSTTAST